MKRTLLFICAAALLAGATVVAQGPPAQPQREIPSPNVSFDRIVNAGQEPQNWLTYSGRP